MWVDSLEYKNDKVFPAQSALINRPNQIHKQSPHSEQEWHEPCEEIIVAKLNRLVVARLSEALIYRIMF